MSSSTFRVHPHGAFAAGFDLLGPSGAPVGAFQGSVWRERGRIQVGGQLWEFRRDGGRRFALAGPTGEPAAAERVSVWSSRWQLWTGGRTYELVKASWLSRRYELRLAGVPVGRLDPKGLLGNKADVELPAELPAPVAVFVVAVAVTLWRREDSAAAAGSAAAAAS